MSYEEEDTCMSCEEEDTCRSAVSRSSLAGTNNTHTLGFTQ